MSNERHDEIAARLHAEAGAQAPERLRADVMLQVRAEPRPRRIRPRHRRMWRPLGAVAAVACVLAALVIGLSHGTSSSPEASLTGAGGGTASAGPSRAPQTAGSPGAIERLAPRPANGSSTYRPLATATAKALDLRAANLPPGLRQALEALILGHGRRAH